MPRQDVNQWDAGKRRIHAPFRALLVPPSYFPPLCSLEFRPSACPPTSHRGFQGSRLHPPPATTSVSSFYLVGCRGVQRHRKKESGIGPLLSSRSLLLSFSFLLCRTRALHPVVAAVRWFVNAKFKLSRAALLVPLRRQWRYQHIHSFQIPPRELSPETPKRAYQWDRKRERKGKNVGCWYLVDFAVIVNEFSQLLYKSNLDCPWNLKRLLTIYLLRRFITHFLFDKTSLLISFYALCAFIFFFKFNLWHERQTIVNFVETSNSFHVTEKYEILFLFIPY